MRPSTVFTGPESSERLVSTPGPMAFLFYGRPIRRRRVFP
jgi:hypothetical protein